MPSLQGPCYTKFMFLIQPEPLQLRLTSAQSLTSVPTFSRCLYAPDPTCPSPSKSCLWVLFPSHGWYLTQTSPPGRYLALVS